jgi:hypothetical protein
MSKVMMNEIRGTVLITKTKDDKIIFRKIIGATLKIGENHTLISFDEDVNCCNDESLSVSDFVADEDAFSSRVIHNGESHFDITPFKNG